jgi:hypothetical protein
LLNTGNISKKKLTSFIKRDWQSWGQIFQKSQQDTLLQPSMLMILISLISMREDDEGAWLAADDEEIREEGPEIP